MFSRLKQPCTVHRNIWWGKFWQTIQVKAIGKGKFWRISNSQCICHIHFPCICEYWQGKVWRMAHDLPNLPLPHFPMYDIKQGCYKVKFSIWEVHCHYQNLWYVHMLLLLQTHQSKRWGRNVVCIHEYFTGLLVTLSLYTIKVTIHSYILHIIICLIYACTRV